jgi:hypothetical protein
LDFGFTGVASGSAGAVVVAVAGSVAPEAGDIFETSSAVGAGATLVSAVGGVVVDGGDVTGSGVDGADTTGAAASDAVV